MQLFWERKPNNSNIWELVSEHFTIDELDALYLAQLAKRPDSFDYRSHIHNAHEEKDRTDLNPLKNTGCIINEITYREVEVVITPGGVDDKGNDIPPVTEIQAKDTGRKDITEYFKVEGEETKTEEEKEQEVQRKKTEIDQQVARIIGNNNKGVEK